MSDDNKSTQVKIVAVVGIVTIIGIAAISGQSPVDVAGSFIINLFMGLFWLVVVGAPIALFAYVVIMCFSDFSLTSSIDLSDMHKHRISQFFKMFGAPEKKKKNKRPTRKSE